MVMPYPCDHFSVWVHCVWIWSWWVPTSEIKHSQTRILLERECNGLSSIDSDVVPCPSNYCSSIMMVNWIHLHIRCSSNFHKWMHIIEHVNSRLWSCHIHVIISPCECPLCSVLKLVSTYIRDQAESKSNSSSKLQPKLTPNLNLNISI